jgi:uncharacterized protein (DUF1330 family)
MAAYLIANIEVNDSAVYETYRAQAPAVIAAYGGRYLVRGGATTVLEGDLVPKRMVILEFPDMAKLKAFHASPDYQRLMRVRQTAATGSLIGVEGI